MKDRKRLDRLLRVKRRLEPARKGELAAAAAALDAARDREAACQAVRLELAQGFANEGEQKAGDLQSRLAMLELSSRACQRAADRRAGHEQQHQQHQERVAEAKREAGLVETLAERVRDEERRTADKQEQQETDEAAARLGGRS